MFRWVSHLHSIQLRTAVLVWAGGSFNTVLLIDANRPQSLPPAQGFGSAIHPDEPVLSRSWRRLRSAMWGHLGSSRLDSLGRGEKYFYFTYMWEVLGQKYVNVMKSWARFWGPWRWTIYFATSKGDEQCNMLFYCPQNNVLSINIPCLSCGCSHPRQFFNSNTRGDEIALHKALHFHTSFYCVCKPSSCLSVVHTPLYCISGSLTAKKSSKV